MKSVRMKAVRQTSWKMVPHAYIEPVPARKNKVDKVGIRTVNVKCSEHLVQWKQLTKSFAPT